MPGGGRRPSAVAARQHHEQLVMARPGAGGGAVGHFALEVGQLRCVEAVRMAVDLHPGLQAVFRFWAAQQVGLQAGQGGAQRGVGGFDVGLRLGGSVFGDAVVAVKLQPAGSG